MSSDYPIGTKGKAWGDPEKAQWLEVQSIKRSYQQQVLQQLETIGASHKVVCYGRLPIDPERYPCYAIHSSNWNDNNPTVLITGGVHGYETSGVQGALRFVNERMADYQQQFNFIVVPCISPWGYETINRWNSNAIDPNRSFYADSPAEESANLMTYVASLKINFIAHFDLHETTDTDNSEFRPALSARDAIEQKTWNIPDGFYGVGDTDNPQPDFQRAIIESVGQVTHIAPADDDGKLIGVPLEQFGVINYAYSPLGLCGGLTNAQYSTTTEVYPDSPKVDDENCNQAQVAAITGGLDYIVATRTKA